MWMPLTFMVGFGIGVGDGWVNHEFKLVVGRERAKIGKAGDKAKKTKANRYHN
jgi:hypothetical protein